MSTQLRVLLVEDSEDDALLVLHELRRIENEVRHERVETREGMIGALRDRTWDLVITDNSMPRFSADEAIRMIRDSGMDIPVLVVSGTMAEEHAVAAMRAGARDFIVKGNLGRLVPVVLRELQEAEGRRARRRAEDALRHATDMQDLVMFQFPFVLYSAEDVVTNWMSDNVGGVTGFPASAFTGDPSLWAGRLHPEDRERVLATLADLKPGVPVHIEYRWKRADGQWRWFLDSFILRGAGNGASREYHGVWLDITERKLLEERFRQAQKMEALGQLAAGVAHDFNNLLTIIQGYGELLAASVSGDARLSGFAKEILAASSRSGALTRQLLAFSRRQVLQPRVLRLNEVVAGSIRMIERLVTQGVRVSTVLDPDAGSVLADAGSLEQVLMNLAVNARDAMSGAGELRILTANVGEGHPHPPATVPPGDWVVLSVADTGCGMEESVMARIFEPFFTTKEQGRGTGLGLATVKGIVERSHGHLLVETAPGKGTTFHVYLPRTREAVVQEPAPTAGVRLEGHEKILLVDDQEAVARVSAGMLEALGYSVLSATSGKAALEILRDPTQVIHLVVTDIVMPDMDGLAFAEGVRAVRPDARVMYVSGHPLSPGSTHRSVPRDAVFLPKPFSRESLGAKVREALGGARHGGAAG